MTNVTATQRIWQREGCLVYCLLLWDCNIEQYTLDLLTNWIFYVSMNFLALASLKISVQIGPALVCYTATRQTL